MVAPRIAHALAAALVSFACSPAQAEPPVAGPARAGSRIALAIAPSWLRAPYDVQILGGDGDALPTYRLRDRFYVQGATDQRYVIRVSNPTPRRIEAVVSVDGLDVIDGENGDLRKRGYIIPPFGETRIEGFRTSLADVATFRFSSVAGSYAGQKGKARNVGVIAVALFEEQPPPPDAEIVGGAPLPPVPYRHDRSDRRSPAAGEALPRTSGSASAGEAAPRTADAASAGATSRPAPSAPPSAKEAEAPGAASARAGSAPGRSAWDDAAGEIAPAGPPRAQRERPGLGTEFGEQRYSAVTYTHFVRAAGRPVAIAELRYNDAAGLIALGVPVQPLPGPDELDLRETAEPFPGDHFARPAR